MEASRGGCIAASISLATAKTEREKVGSEWKEAAGFGHIEFSS